jgi:hypothetical protein
MEKVNQKKEQGKWHRFLRNSCQDVLYKFKILSNITRPFTIKIVENYHQVEPCRPLFGNGCPINSHSNPMLALLGQGHHLHHHRSSLQTGLLLAVLL